MRLHAAPCFKTACRAVTSLFAVGQKYRKSFLAVGQPVPGVVRSRYDFQALASLSPPSGSSGENGSSAERPPTLEQVRGMGGGGYRSCGGAEVRNGT